MAYPADPGRTFVLRARRDTIFLVAGAVGMTFALSSVIHSRVAQPGAASTDSIDQQAWTGALADVADASSGAHELLTSASLVVPTNELALPKVTVRPLVKLHGCDGSICPAKIAAPIPAKRPGVTIQPSVVTASIATGPRPPASKHTKPNLMSRLNPFNHLPDMAKIRRPFTVAGDTVSSWFRF